MENRTPESLISAPDKVNKIRCGRAKTIKVKTILQLILVIFLTAVIIFGCLYYYGKRPWENIKPVFPMEPPKLLYSIYQGQNKFLHPITAAVDKGENLYVSNNDIHTVEVISPNGKPAMSFGGSGKLPGQLLFPYGIGFLPNGNLLVAETGNFRIQELTAKGKYVRTFLGQHNNIGLTKPGPICIDSKGRVYVGDLSGSQVLVLDQNARVLRRIGNIAYPHGIAVDEERKKLYISDSGEINVKVFSLEKDDSKPINVIETTSPGTRFSMVRGLALDRLGRLYVVDTITGAVRVFDKNGTYLFSFGQVGFDDGEFLYPIGISVSDSGKIYIADWSNNRVQVWGY